jgi:YNFM family putative membrane transporter
LLPVRGPTDPTGFQHEFALTSFQAILFTTLMMLPLGFAPMFYGVLLESLSARLIVRTAVLLLGGLELVFSQTSNYLLLLILRGLQGMVIPAILTSLVSYISFTAPREDVQTAIARLHRGHHSRRFPGTFPVRAVHRSVRLAVFLLSPGCTAALAFFPPAHPGKGCQPCLQPAQGGRGDGIDQAAAVFLALRTIFAVFFVFAGLLNFLPFQLKAINPAFRETGIGFMYFGM